jgi:hypothetical protein
MALKDYCAGSAEAPFEGKAGHFVATNRVDFSAVNLAGADTAKAIEIKAGWCVKRVWWKIVTPEVAADTISVGDSANATSWNAAEAMNQAAGTVGESDGGVDAYAVQGGKYYAAADYILLTPNAAITALVLDVCVEVVVPF